MNQKPSFIFMGTPDVAVESLEKLFRSGYIPKLIITAPDRPVGRGLVMTQPPVKVWADEHSIPTLQPEKITAEVIQAITEINPEISIVVAYGKILPEKLITLPKLGTLNIHYSLLPRFRGASPVESAILFGDTETGVAIQSMVYELDAGNILTIAKTPIHPDETAPELRARLSTLGAETLVNTLNHLPEQLVNKQSQSPDGVITCGKIKKTDGDITNDTDQVRWNKYRAYYGWPGVYYFDEHGKRIKITQARFEKGTFIIERVIPEGKGEIEYKK
jgi:methionyl-tRNA formyltransferase